MQRDEPKYQAIMHALLSRLRAGEWAVGDQIPSENELARQYGVSRVTIQRTLRELVFAGIVVRSAGAGTFVTSLRVRPAFVRLDDLTGHEYKRKGQREILTTRLWRHRRVSAGALYLVVRWLRDGTVQSVEHWLLDARAFGSQVKAKCGSSLFDRLQERVVIDTIDEESCFATLPCTVRARLRIDDSDPRFSIRRRFYSRGQWVGSVWQAYATTDLSVKHRYSTLAGLSHERPAYPS